MKDKDELFDRILESIGGNGKFQKYFNYSHNLVFVTFCSMSYMNLVMMMVVPEHHCHIPGRENTTYSPEQWNEMHLPKEEDMRGKISYSRCRMYIDGMKNATDKTIGECQFGYDYDNTWYTNTIPTDENWVCDKGLYVSNILAASRLGKVGGTFLLGQLADYIGRRPIYLIGIVLTILTKVIGFFTSSYYYVFIITTAFSLFPIMAVMQSALVVGMEVTDVQKRSSIAQFQNIGFSLGMVILALIFWAFPSWPVSYVLNSLPMMFSLFTYRWFIESPKWLLSKGKIKEAIVQLKTIAKINNTQLRPELEQELYDYKKSSAPERSFGILSLFTSWRLTKNTILINIATILSMVGYFVVVINATNLDGNPFLNFMWQGAVEIPAYLFAKPVFDKIGRRFTGSLAFFLAGVTFSVVIFMVRDDNMLPFVNSLVMVGKLFLSITLLLVILQSLELYPTCVRQTGLAMVVAISGGFCVSGPYIVYLGTAFDARYPYLILAMMAFSGAICEFLLPETLHVKLPETLRDASMFGKDQSYFKLPRKPKQIDDAEELKFLPSKDTKLPDLNTAG